MLIHAGSRKSGKTEKAIIMANSTKSLLIVQSSVMADYVKKMAQKMGYFVDVISVKEYFNNPGFYKNRTLVIDEIDIVLKEVFGTNVVMATTTGAMIDERLNYAHQIINEHGGY